MVLALIYFQCCAFLIEILSRAHTKHRKDVSCFVDRQTETETDRERDRDREVVKTALIVSDLAFLLVVFRVTGGKHGSERVN